MTLWTLFQGLLLMANGLAILNNERFLEKVGWGYSQMYAGSSGGERPGSMKRGVISFVHAMFMLKEFWGACNVVVIFVKLIFG